MQSIDPVGAVVGALVGAEVGAPVGADVGAPVGAVVGAVVAGGWVAGTSVGVCVAFDPQAERIRVAKTNRLPNLFKVDFRFILFSSKTVKIEVGTSVIYVRSFKMDEVHLLAILIEQIASAQSANTLGRAQNPVRL